MGRRGELSQGVYGVVVVALIAIAVSLGISTVAWAEGSPSDSVQELSDGAGTTASGTWGTCPWDLSSNGTLTIHPGMGDITRPWDEFAQDIKEVKAVSENGEKVVAPTNIAALFQNCHNLTNANLSGFDTSQATNMYGMFSGCFSLASLNVSGWDTSQVTNMAKLFQDCSSLASLDIAEWDTSKAETIREMFRDCRSLTSLDLSGWSTSNATDLFGVFWGCRSLGTLDVSRWDVGKATDMTRLFSGCSALTGLDVSRWDTAHVTSMHALFEGCPALTTLDVSRWDTSQVTDMRELFSGCSALAEVDVSQWATSQTTDMNGMFTGCAALTSLDISRWDTSRVGDFGGMFSGCSSLATLGVSDLDTAQATDMSSMFSGCSSLATLDVADWNTAQVATMNNMFSGCVSLAALDVSAWDISRASDLSGMFSECSSLAAIDVSRWNTSQVTDMSYLFCLCTSLEGVDASAWDTAQVRAMDEMFRECTSLTYLDASGWNLSQIRSQTDIFDGCALDELRIGEGYFASSQYGAFTSIPESRAHDGRWWSDAADRWFTRWEVKDRGSVADTYLSTTTRPVDLSSAIVTAAGRTYTGEPFEPKVRVELNDSILAEDRDYTVAYENNINAGTATVLVTGKGGYTGVATGSFLIKRASISGATCTVEDQSYTGSAIKPAATVMLNGKVLEEGVDYTSSFKNNIAVGEATITVTGSGNYTGLVTSCFTINPASIAKAVVSADNQIYTGKAQTPAVTVKLGTKTLKAGTDYTVSYANNVKAGTATITVTGMGSYTGTAKGTFTITKVASPFIDVSEGTSHYADIIWLADQGISTGWEMPAGKEFRPTASVKRGDMAAFLFRLAKQWGALGASDSWKPSSAIKGKFADVNDRTPHAQAIWWMAQYSISAGWTIDGRVEFRPNANVKRGDLAAFLNRLALASGRRGVTSVSGVGFADVGFGTSHLSEIRWLAANGISTGWEVKGKWEFRPNAEVKRGDMAAFLHRLDGVK